MQDYDETEDGDGGNAAELRGRIRDARGQLLEGCPVVALGVRGDHAYFLDALGQMRHAKDLKLQFIASLFAANFDYLCNAFPVFTKDDEGVVRRKPSEFKGNAASHALWRAAGECGVFNPDNTVRGSGAWLDDDGELVYHLGDVVFYKNQLLPPGRIAGRIYQAEHPLPRPSTKGPDPAEDILDTLETWNWAVPDLHPFVALGMIAIQMMGGALRWRPTFWLTAPAASGKSSFQELLQHLHGEALIHSVDTTKSGITSRIRQSSLPVTVDELEPGDERSNKEREIINLARLASSGGDWSRGSPDQASIGGKVYSAFMFSSILIPGIMKTQDLQRLIRLDMNRIEDTRGLSLSPRTWRARGVRLKGRLIERWATLPERIGVFRHALEEEGVTGRNADNWEIVLAMADMAKDRDVASAEVARAWARKAALQVQADRDDVTNDADALIAHLLGQVMDPFRRGEQWTVAQWIMVAAGLKGAPSQLLPTTGDAAFQIEDRRKRATEVLRQYGLGVYMEDEQTLFIGNRGPMLLGKLFEGSQWSGGAWAQSARRIPRAYVPKTTKTLAGVTTRGTMIPLTSIPSLHAFPDNPSDAKTAATERDGGQVDNFEHF
ncbi:hypothetical protein [Sagittula sp. P11]|uniref:hypothetical protein n=1 Tax=Sagittula sp. P11 TaxID=2009329 RepID=UPI0012FDCDB8|nr:hypothetical protein [Sagittula sp. P11]